MSLYTNTKDLNLAVRESNTKVKIMKLN